MVNQVKFGDHPMDYIGVHVNRCHKKPGRYVMQELLELNPVAFKLFHTLAYSLPVLEGGEFPVFKDNEKADAFIMQMQTAKLSSGNYDRNTFKRNMGILIEKGMITRIKGTKYFINPFYYHRLNSFYLNHLNRQLKDRHEYLLKQGMLQDSD